MRAENPATVSDLGRLLGEVDPLVAERILETGASADEIGEALIEVEDEEGFGEEPREATSARVANVRAVLHELLDNDEDDAGY